MPSQTAAYDAALATSLAGIPAQAAADGAAVGAAAARAILELRTGDGWERPFPPLDLPSLPGYWKSTPPNNPTVTFTNYPGARGFIVENGRRFLPEGPPALTSERYATDFNQVKAWGAVNSTVRSAEQTQISNYWAGVGTTTPNQNVWNNLLGDLARSRGWSGLDLARGYALLNMTFHDALLTSFTGKFIYGLWRPVTAVREADTDGNDATAGRSDLAAAAHHAALSERARQHGLHRRIDVANDGAAVRPGQHPVLGDLDRRRHQPVGDALLQRLP